MKLSMPKLQERDQALILIAFGLLAAVAVYLLVYQRFTEETQALESTNSTMQQQISLLQRLTDNRAQYESDTEQFIVDAQEILDTFPVDLMEEDLMNYALHLDQLEDETFVGSISTPRREPVGLAVPAREDDLVSANDITGQIQANAYVNDGSVMDVNEAVLNTANSSIALTTSYNGFKNLIIDIIGWEETEEEIPEETDTIIDEEDTPGAETPEEDAVDTENEIADPETGSETSEPVIDTENGFEEGTEEDSNYGIENNKKTRIVAQRRVNRVDLSFAEDSGEYMAMVDVNFFSMEGMGREYVRPDPGVEDHGLNNLFGSQFSNGTLLPPLSDLDPNYIAPQPGENIFSTIQEGDGEDSISTERSENDLTQNNSPAEEQITYYVNVDSEIIHNTWCPTIQNSIGRNDSPVTPTSDSLESLLTHYRTCKDCFH